MAYILENDVLKLECAGKGGEMLHLVKKSTDHETLYQGDQKSFFISNGRKYIYKGL